MRFNRWTWFLLLLALPPLTFACSDEEPGGATATPAVLDDLAPALPSAEEIGQALPSLAPIQPEYFQGPRTNEDEVSTAIDPTKTQQEIDEFGRVTGYEGSYKPEEGEEEILVGLALFETVEGANRWLQARSDVDQLVQLYGPDAEVEEFDAGDVGNEAKGITATLNVAVTTVILRVGNVVAFAQVAVSQEDVTGEVTELARLVAEKVQALLEA